MNTRFQHFTPVQVRFADIDAMGHVNNANFLTYIEIARIRYSNDVLGADIDFSRQGFILAKATIDFILPIELGDEVRVATRCSRIGNKSFDLEYEIMLVNCKPHRIVAKAHTVLVGYDYHDKKSIRIPDEWKKRIEVYEK